MAPARHAAVRPAPRVANLLPYRAALVFSLAIAATVTPLPLSDPPTTRSVVVYGLVADAEQPHQDEGGTQRGRRVMWSWDEVMTARTEVHPAGADDGRNREGQKGTAKQ
jgi:hypothetical protein